MTEGRSAEETELAPSKPSSSLGRQALVRWIRRYAIFLILGALIIVFEAEQPAFLRVDNLFSVLQAVSVVALLGVGVTFTLAVSGFDLSVGSTAVLCLMLSSFAMVVFQFNAAETIALALTIGGLVGLANGFLIVALRIPDLLATLGMMFLLSGLTLIPSGGRSITTGLVLPNGVSANGRFDPNFLYVGRHRVWDLVPLPVIVVALIAIIAWFLMERTRWGRVFYAVGGNEAAAHLAGAPTKKYRVAAYVISGVLGALGGVFHGCAYRPRRSFRRVFDAARQRGGGFDWLRRSRSATAQRRRHSDGRGLCRHFVEWPHHAECALLRSGLREGRGACRRARRDLRNRTKTIIDNWTGSGT
jgi:simple sugar transport system permease protein